MFLRVVPGWHSGARVRADTRALVPDMELGCLLLPEEVATCSEAFSLFSFRVWPGMKCGKLCQAAQGELLKGCIP